MFTQGWIQERMRDAVESFDITLQQYNVLRILRGSYPDPISTQEIRKRMLDKMSDVSRIVDRLILKNLVTKRVCGSDKRLVDVTISETGLKLLTEMDVLEAQMDETMNNLSVEEAKTLNLLLDKLRNA